jgi:hypothetical protein
LQRSATLLSSPIDNVMAQEGVKAAAGHSIGRERQKKVPDPPLHREQGA